MELFIKQDIYYTAKYGLFIVTCDASKVSDKEYQTRHSKVLHLDMSRTVSYNNYNVIVPDFAFNNELNATEYFSFEMESVTIDPRTQNMIVAVNANSPTPNADGVHPGEDYIYRFSTIKFE